MKTTQMRFFLLFILIIFISACGSRIALLKKVPSSYEIANVQSMTFKPFEYEFSYYKASSRANSAEVQSLEQQIYSVAINSHLFSSCSYANSCDAILSGKIHDFSVTERRKIDKRSKEVDGPNGKQTLYYDVPMIDQEGKLILEVTIYDNRGRSLGTRRYERSSYNSYEERYYYNHTPSVLRAELIKKVAEDFYNDLVPRTETYHVGLGSAPDHLKPGVELLKSTDWASAARFFKNAIQANSSDADAYYYLGLSYEMGKDFAKSYQSYSQAANLGNKNASKALKRVESLQSAEEKYQKDIQLRKKN